VTRITWSPQSLRDLESIHAYIAGDSFRYADLTIRRIVAAVERLAALPESGRMVPERNQHDTREVIVGGFRVVYRLRPQAVEIVTVFRGSRALPRHI
jgi:toxin ParE1/3/4